MKIIAKKSLGQHFLRDTNVVRRMVAINDVKGKNVLEIGPGMGILTQSLLESGANVVAVELDNRVIDMLKDRFASYGSNMTLIHGDILDIGPEKIFKDREYIVISNIPYYITGLIISTFLDAKNKPKSMTLLVQKEVAMRIVAKDGKQSILSIAVRAYGKPEISFIVKKGAFDPVPKVDSAVIKIDNIGSIRENKLNEARIDQESFLKCVKVGFAHKRKILFANLCNEYSRESVENAWSILGLDKNIRAQDVDIDVWFKIAGILYKKA
jgi:16S rRNA (adenine1518-N6/adenine1519-N6)-dimethyltransferase